MKKSICALIMLTAFYFQAGHADGAKVVNGCIEACHEHYQKKGNLQDFNGRWAVNEEAEKLLGKAFVKDSKKKLCKEEIESLKKCYAESSKAYAICKFAAYTFTSIVTSDPNWKDYFGSCKDTCAKTLKNFCTEN